MAGLARYSNVIFDFCDVLVDWQPRVPLEGQAPDEVIDHLFDRNDPYGFWHYDELSDLGWSEERILADYARHHGLSGGEQEQAFRLYFERQKLALVGMLPGMPEILHDLDAAGVRCWGLTNFTVKYVDAARELFPALGLLKDVVVSSAEQIHKPDLEIFKRAIARFGIDPACTAFVDDKPWNAEAGTAAGLHGIRFTGADALRAQLFG
ncbi:alpha beta hydrolase [Bifidobacterium saguini DSM 23967]|uniref:HAD family phosphatase n=3 Tax=Bifidobacterium TaxID=1678 RepID=A0A2N5ISV4_9BIFI|nr:MULTISPECIES: HAD family phosphatase [Bifidobacterium]KFI92694.1 alpha beta hydrolase [Bifidobacterium saguini DSM 23967]PLS25040.1 hydrolase [Bifidobacterium imperatoris]QSY58670.1 HAD family phosphatase [Bifidobacterium imperatoris]QTB91703.1 HAD family phosphatase [Bifidobacterium saguini]